MDTISEGLKVVSEIKDWVTLLAAVAFMIIFWEPIAQRIGWKKPKEIETNIGLSADFRNALQPLLGQMEVLSQHFNHETTDQNDKIVEILDKVSSVQQNQCRKIDMLVSAVDDIRVNGVRIKK